MVVILTPVVLMVVGIPGSSFSKPVIKRDVHHPCIAFRLPGMMVKHWPLEKILQDSVIYLHFLLDKVTQTQCGETFFPRDPYKFEIVSPIGSKYGILWYTFLH